MLPILDSVFIDVSALAIARFCFTHFSSKLTIRCAMNPHVAMIGQCNQDDFRSFKTRIE
jgi:hypothetical protein